jgi:hypothetical protein
MPYNVITFTCTVLALYFGSLLNALRRRIGKEERELNKTGKHKYLCCFGFCFLMPRVTEKWLLQTSDDNLVDALTVFFPFT